MLTGSWSRKGPWSWVTKLEELQFWTGVEHSKIKNWYIHTLLNKKILEDTCKWGDLVYTLMIYYSKGMIIKGIVVR